MANFPELAPEVCSKAVPRACPAAMVQGGLHVQSRSISGRRLGVLIAAMVCGGSIDNPTLQAKLWPIVGTGRTSMLVHSLLVFLFRRITVVFAQPFSQLKDVGFVFDGD